MAAATTNPIEPASNVPGVSKKTIFMSGLLVDVYGLTELDPTVSRVSCLWLHHPRSGSKEDMGTIAMRLVSAWSERRRHTPSSSAGAPSPGLIALAFDQRNHGSRRVHPSANNAWREGNETHAQDMFGTISGTVADQVCLLDAVGGYLFHDGDQGVTMPVIDQHLALGVSLGGHSVWQLMFVDSRVCAGVPAIGCPDYISLMSNRAKLSKRPAYTVDSGASFLGSKDFPAALVDTCKRFDPKAIFFGTGSVPPPSSPLSLSEAEKRRIESIVRRIRGKKFLLCSGGADKLVPYDRGKAFLDWFKDATATWLRHENVSIDDRVYPGIGHKFDNAGMFRDAQEFILDVVENGVRLHQGNKEGQASPKI